MIAHRISVSEFPFVRSQVTDMMNGKGQDVYRLPPPTTCPVSPSGEPINLRIPQTEKPTVSKVLYEMYLFISAVKL